MKTTIFKWILLLLLLGYTAWVAVWANREAEQHKCTGVIVKIVGNKNKTVVDRTKRGIEMELAKYPDPIKGVSIHKVNTKKVEDYLASIANFESVKCMINSDNHLLVEAKPLEPVMRVFDGDKSYYINREGKRIDARAEFFTDVPVVFGRFNSTFTPRDVLPLVKYIDSDPKLSNLTAMIEAKDSRNLILVPRIKGHVVNFGDTSDLKKKTKNLFLFYRKVMPHKGWETYDTVSVKFAGQVVATRRNKQRLVAPVMPVDEVDLEEQTLPQVADLPLPVKNTANAVDTTKSTNNNNTTTTP